MLDGTQFAFPPGHSMTDQVFTLQITFEKSWRYAKDAQAPLLTLRKHMTGFLVKMFGCVSGVKC